jgi:hypothetical protein
MKLLLWFAAANLQGNRQFIDGVDTNNPGLLHEPSFNLSSPNVSHGFFKHRSIDPLFNLFHLVYKTLNHAESGIAQLCLYKGP